MHSHLDSQVSPQTESQEKPEKERSPLFEAFLEKLKSFSTFEEKISHGLQFMRSSISQEGSPHFREFWESRKEILPFFKENLNPAIRSNLWNEYIELTVEARRLKDILEEESEFAMEQIDLAVDALSKDLENLGAVSGFKVNEDLLKASRSLAPKFTEYKRLQEELHVLSTFATRLNGLRKEIVKTDMRVRFKTKFFKKMSHLGDQIFPRRKELVEAVSSAFEADIDEFVLKYFQDGAISGAPYYALRDEIKSLQTAAKELTLNSAVFTKTRLKLSECWDQVKLLEKEYKKDLYEKRQASSAEREAIEARIDELKGKELSFQELTKEIDVLSNEMRQITLTREDVSFLRAQFKDLKEPHLKEQERRAKEFEEEQKEKLRLKKEALVSIKDRIVDLSEKGSSLSLEEVEKEFSSIQDAFKSIAYSKMEKQQFDRSLRPLKDLVAEKKEQSLLNLSDDEKKVLENLKTVLENKKQRRQEIKLQLEVYRKAQGLSGFDFEKAMHYQELVEQEKELLEKTNLGIEEIESKIQELEGL